MNEEQKNQAWEEELKESKIWSLFQPIMSGELVAKHRDIEDFIRTLRQKDKERLMDGIEKLWRTKMSITESMEYMDGYRQSLEDALKFLSKNYE